MSILDNDQIRELTQLCRLCIIKARVFVPLAIVTILYNGIGSPLTTPHLGYIHMNKFYS